MSYYETWKYTKGELASVAPYVGVVALAFIRPDTAYVSGSMSLSDLQFSGVDGPTIKSEIQKLQSQGQKVGIQLCESSLELHKPSHLAASICS